MTARWKLAGALGALALAAAVPAGAGAASLPADTTAILSGTPDLLSAFALPADNSSSGREQAVSEDGSRAVFESDSDGLSGEDDDLVQNVYVKDMASGAVQLVSRATGEHGEPAHADCDGGAISADGHQVAFTCDGPLDPADTNGKADVYVRNLDTQVTTLVSRVPGGAVGDRASDQPAIAVSGGTTFVAFISDATNLLGGAPIASAERVYRRSFGTGSAGSIALVSEKGVPGLADSAVQPSISDDGSRVAFATSERLDPADAGSDQDVYVRDFTSGATIFASRLNGLGGAGVDGGSFTPAISGDGSAVAFGSREPLDSSDKNVGADVYVRSLTNSTTTLVSTTTDGRADGGSFEPSTDRTGRTVAFISDSGAVTPDSPAGTDSAYVFKLGAGVRLLVSRSGPTGPAAGVPEAAMSGDGLKVVLFARPLNGVTLSPDLGLDAESVVLRDVASGVNRTVSRPPGDAPFVNAGGIESGGALSADGRFAAFVSEAPALGSADGVDRLFVRDLVTGAVTLASRADGANGAPMDVDGAADTTPPISADGQRVAFESGGQVFVRDLAAGRTFAVSVADGAGGAPGNGDSAEPSISADGQRVAFASRSSNLTANDSDTNQDVFVRDLAAGRTTLVDVVGGTDAKIGGGFAEEPAISDDGRSVAFDTDVSVDPSVDTSRSTVFNVFVHRLDSGATVLASVAGATLGTGDSFAPSIDRDGGRVSFLSDARSFGVPAQGEELFVRDLAARTLTVAGRADGAAGAPLRHVGAGVLSADGEHLAFAAAPSASGAPGDPGDGFTRVYERDLATDVTRLISRRSGVDGAALASDSSASVADITADGGCVSFDANEPLLPGQVFSFFGNVYVRAVSSNCGRPDPNPPGGGPGPGPGGGTPVAVLSKLALKPARFHVGGRRGGTKIVFRLDRAASVTLAFDRLLPGRRAKAKRVHGHKGKLGPCSTKRRHGGVRCTVVKRFGRLVLAQSKLHAGANAVKFSGRIGRKALAPGRYRLTATPLHGKARTVTFTVVKAPKPKHRNTHR